MSGSKVSWFQGQRGSVTAEFALALPAIALVLAVTVGSFALQIERITLVTVAASISRAAARGDDPLRLIAEYSQQKVIASTKDEGVLVCATANKAVGLLGLPGAIFELQEIQCARKNGL